MKTGAIKVGLVFDSGKSTFFRQNKIKSLTRENQYPSNKSDQTANTPVKMFKNCLKSCTCPIKEDAKSQNIVATSSESAVQDSLNLPFSTGKVNHEEDTTDKLSSEIYVNQGKKLAAFIQKFNKRIFEFYFNSQ